MSATTYDLIQSSTASGSSITFSSIPSTYTDLRLAITIRSSAGYNCGLRFNGDTASNYTKMSQGWVNGSPGNLTTGYSASTTYFDLSEGWTPSGSSSYSCWTVDIYNYANTNFYKNAMGYESSVDFPGGGYAVTFNSATWKNTAAINSITFVFPSGGAATDGQINLYGIKAA